VKIRDRVREMQRQREREMWKSMERSWQVQREGNGYREVIDNRETTQTHVRVLS